MRYIWLLYQVGKHIFVLQWATELEIWVTTTQKNGPEQQIHLR